MSDNKNPEKSFDTNYETNPHPEFPSAEAAHEYIFNCRKRLWILIRAVGIDDVFADEILDRALKDLARKWNSYNPKIACFMAWAFTIAYRRALDGVRRTYRQEKLLDRLTESGNVSQSFYGRMNGQLFATPFEEFDPHACQHLQSLLPAVLFQLTPKQSKALTLVYLQELDQQEAARSMGVTHGNLRTTLHRALKAARRKLEHIVADKDKSNFMTGIHDR